MFAIKETEKGAKTQSCVEILLSPFSLKAGNSKILINDSYYYHYCDYYFSLVCVWKTSALQCVHR